MERCYQTLMEELAEHVGVRVTVIWHCDGAIACSTGEIIEVGRDFVEVHGLVPTFDECGPCDDLKDCELDTVIPLDRVCAVVECVPKRRKAGVPLCCGVNDPRPAGTA